MEKFINNLYSNSNFPIILGALIIIFVVLFVITLILALKDAKNNMELEVSKDREDKENKDNVVFKEPEKEETEEKVSFENVSFDKEEEKQDEKPKYEGISFEEVSGDTVSDGTSKVDVIEETTQTIPVLKDDEISNFEDNITPKIGYINFDLSFNLKDKKDGNIFDFSKKEDKVTEENKKTTSVALEDDTNAINGEPTKEVVPFDMELPKMKQEYTFKDLDGESYRLNK